MAGAGRNGPRTPVPLLHQGRADHLGRRVRRAVQRAARPGGAPPRAAGGRFAHAAGRRGGFRHRLRRGGAPGADAEPRRRLRHRRANRLEQSRRERDRQGPALPVRAQDRRGGPVAGLPRRPAGTRRHPGRRPGRRGRDAQRTHHRRRARTPLAQRRLPGSGAARGARRGVLPARRLRGAQRQPGRRRQGAVRQSAQQRGRVAAPEEPGRHRAAQAADDLPRHRPHRGVLAENPARGLHRAERVGAAGGRTDRAGARAGRGAGADRLLGRAPLRPATRDRRCGGQSRRRRVAAPARRHLARAAVGGRLQVPAPGGADQAPRHPRQRRAHRARHPVCVHDPGQGGRVDGGAGHPAQRRRGQAQGRADRRHRDDPQGRRRDPRGAGPGRRPARRHRTRIRHAHNVSRVRHPAGAGQGGRRRHPLPQRPVLPGAAARAGVSRRRPRRTRHRGAGLRGGHRAAQGRGDRRRGRLVRAHRGRPAAHRAVPDQGRHVVRERHTAAAEPAEGEKGCAVACFGGAVDPARGADGGARPGDRVRRSGLDHVGVHRAARRGGGGRPDDRGGAHRMVHRRLAPRDRGQVAGRRRADGRRARRQRAAHAGGADGGGHRVAGRFLPRRRQGGDPGARRQGRRFGVEEDRLRGGRRFAGLQVRQGGRARRAHPGRGRLPQAAGRGPARNPGGLSR
ncbi:LigA [Mycobacterium avium subsp. paratuberculosis K-10]|uniref:LigA n=1 Tax=Mycolicibacterium paratuberculosis (strain ATCC BAA-968 / K-10) TaxID=262316 RepID=Q73VG0_MYCPA|nr:LigA [Mycobacterium avium subsp. paratuberculosis K-10]